MKYGNPKLRQMLAAEYVLGTLQSRARKRFERLMRADGAVAAEVRWWEQRLAALGLRLPPTAPRERVWAAIDLAINSADGGREGMGRVQLPPARMNLWRVWAIAASLASIGLAFQLWQQINTAPQIIEVPRVVSVPQPLPYVAVLQPGGDVKFLLALSPERGIIKVSVSGSQPPVDYTQRSLELWVLDAAGKPHSLGVMPESGTAEMPMPKGTPMPESPTLAISVEPKGGSTTGAPTGPVLTAAPALRAA